jgi:hypothetical protein
MLWIYLQYFVFEIVALEIGRIICKESADMGKIVVGIILFCFYLAGASDKEKVCDSTVFFPNVFLGFEEMSKSLDVYNDKSASITDRMKAGIYFFLEGTKPGLKKKEMTPLLNKSVVVLESAWSEDKSNNRLRLLLAYSYTAYCGANISIEDIMKYIAKARNLFSLVIAKLPENIDARLGRLRVNVSMPAGSSRPDDIILDDADVYIKKYDILPAEEKNSFYFQQGLTEAYLARAIVYDYRKQRELARENLLKVDTSLLTAHTKKLHKPIAGKYE